MRPMPTPARRRQRRRSSPWCCQGPMGRRRRPRPPRVEGVRARHRRGARTAAAGPPGSRSCAPADGWRPLGASMYVSAGAPPPPPPPPATHRIRWHRRELALSFFRPLLFPIVRIQNAPRFSVRRVEIFVFLAVEQTGAARRPQRIVPSAAKRSFRRPRSVVVGTQASVVLSLAAKEDCSVLLIPLLAAFFLFLFSLFFRFVLSLLRRKLRPSVGRKGDDRRRPRRHQRQRRRRLRRRPYRGHD